MKIVNVIVTLLQNYLEKGKNMIIIHHHSLGVNEQFCWGNKYFG